MSKDNRTDNDIKPQFSNNCLMSVNNVSNFYISRNSGIFGRENIKNVLNNANLEMKKGEILGLTGKSGCGKTTLARCILGMIDYLGVIFIDGLKQENKFRRLQMIFQEPGASLNPLKNIGWLLEEPLVIHKIGTKKERRKIVDEMLQNVGMDISCKSSRSYELSGGQKQRICIGRALILKPRFLIADEAISSLDVSSGAQILNLFRRLHIKNGLDILFISHNKDAVEYLCDRVVEMKDGAIT